MAGGEGAKERRRLKRLSAQDEKNKSASSLQTSIGKEKSKSKNNCNGERKRSSNYSDVKRRKPDSEQQRFSNNKNHRTTKNSSKKTIRKEKRQKTKKPKHLKRKLEQASNENEKAKEVIKKEIEQFETKKKKYSKLYHDNKRQRMIAIDVGDGSNNINNYGAESRLNKTNDNCSPFPRSENVEKKKPAVINDDNIELRDSKEIAKPKANNRKDMRTKTDSIPQECLNHSNADDDSSDDGSGDEVAGENTFSEIISHGSIEDKLDQPCDSGDSFGGNFCSEADDSSDDDEPVQKRQRGRRRVGRQDTAKKIEEMEAVAKRKAAASTDNKSNINGKDDNTKTGKKRYCIGRKPVTDFVVGESRGATVVYVKPFGVFFDIGCHSDAFCHVSRLSDDFVESPESKFKEGDEIPKVRIVEIDRKQKRITLSLQSDARVEDERQSIEARKSRKERTKKKLKKTTSNNSFGRDRSEIYPRFNSESTSFSKEPAVNRAASTLTKKNIDSSIMTPAELKRSRKLARRAERRAHA